MKIFIYSIILFLPIKLLGQDDSLKNKVEPQVIALEVEVSYNYGVFINSNVTPKSGFGLGVYGVFWNHKPINMIVGLEYAFTRFHVDEFRWYKQITADFNPEFGSFLIPIKSRFNIGRKVKFVLELGWYLDIAIHNSKEDVITVGNGGTYTLNQTVEGLRSFFNTGPTGSIGMGIPIGRFCVIIKCAVNYGILPIEQSNNVQWNSIKNQFAKFSIGFLWPRNPINK